MRSASVTALPLSVALVLNTSAPSSSALNACMTATLSPVLANTI